MQFIDLPPGVRDATTDDVAAIVQLVRDLAAYERAVEQAQMTPEQLYQALFSPDAVATALVAEVDVDVVGFALWYRTFSTWDGVPGIHLEDLYVRPEHRGAGHGLRMFVSLARTALAHGYTRIEWDVLTWNTPSIEFYESLDAVRQDEWLAYRLTGQAIEQLARR